MFSEDGAEEFGRNDRFRLDRRALLRRGAAAGLSLPLLSVLSTGCDAADDEVESRTFAAMYQDWMLRLYPQLAGVGTPRPTMRVVDLNRLARAARDDRAAADVYVGLTPFEELARLVRAEVLAPWDEVMPTDVASGLPAPVVRESSLDGGLYSWPFLLDVTILGWNSELVERAELDPGRAPRSWDDLIGAARAVVRSGAAPYGCTFDPRPWRSLVPVAYSFSIDVYDENDRFDFKSEAAFAALEVLRQMRELANPDVLEGRLTAGAGLTPDEGVFAAGLAAYYVKYQNAHIRNAATWPDPSRLVLARLPQPSGGAGKTVFWTVGLGLVRFSRAQAAAARYARSVTESDDFWRVALGGGRSAVGHVPALESLWRRWRRERPPWLEPWSENIRAQLDHAEPIRLSTAGVAQFLRAQPELDRYLRGEEPSARRALERAAAAAA